MAETPVSNSSSNENDNTFWNYFMVIVVIIIVWFVFFKNKEGFAGLFSPNPLPSLSKIPKQLGSENKDKAMKIIQKINKIDKALNDQQNYSDQYQMDFGNNSSDNHIANLKPSLNQNDDYEQLMNDPTSQYAMAPLDEPAQSAQSANSMYPNLEKTRPYSSRDQRVNSTLSKFPQAQNMTGNGSTGLMNQAGLLDGEQVACNMLGVNTANMDSYKKKFYSMYAHQIECPSKCKLKADGMSKGCGMGSKCGLGKDCSNINSDTSIPDTFALNYLALDNANKKPCVTCNFKPTRNPLNREWMERDVPSYDGLPEDVKIADEARLKKMGLIDANVSNYVNFENNVYQDSVGESAPDRINEIRTCQDAYGTCSLKDYGSSIANAYDKLTANPAYTSRNNCNPYQLTGVLEDAAPTDMYASIH